MKVRSLRELEPSNGSGSRSLTLLGILALTILSTALMNASSEVGWIGVSSGDSSRVWPWFEPCVDSGCADMSCSVEGADCSSGFDMDRKSGVDCLDCNRPACCEFCIVLGI